MNTRYLCSRTNLALSIILIATVFGIVSAWKEIQSIQEKRAQMPFVFGGDMFEGIKSAIVGERMVGYITDRDMKNDKVSMRFAQAQLTLVPAILDLNNTAHRFVVIDFDDPRKAAMALKLIQANPIRQGGPGLILAERLRP
ncbi:MAG: hypothetical protein HQL19_04700 [Candidatus Omnitrophica bacterium]|nr:hypothetical protein [Candidatus Omnitrophota bacterium]